MVLRSRALLEPELVLQAQAPLEPRILPVRRGLVLREALLAPQEMRRQAVRVRAQLVLRAQALLEPEVVLQEALQAQAPLEPGTLRILPMRSGLVQREASLEPGLVVLEAREQVVRAWFVLRSRALLEPSEQEQLREPPGLEVLQRPEMLEQL